MSPAGCRVQPGWANKHGTGWHAHSGWHNRLQVTGSEMQPRHLESRACVPVGPVLLGQTWPELEKYSQLCECYFSPDFPLLWKIQGTGDTMVPTDPVQDILTVSNWVNSHTMPELGLTHINECSQVWSKFKAAVSEKKGPLGRGKTEDSRHLSGTWTFPFKRDLFF